MLEDGSSAQFTPGGCKDFFNLDEYRKEIGKDFKRITLYLCPLIESMKYEGLNDANEVFQDNADNLGLTLTDFGVESSVEQNVASFSMIESAISTTGYDTFSPHYTTSTINVVTSLQTIPTSHTSTSTQHMDLTSQTSSSTQTISNFTTFNIKCHQ